MMKNIVLAVSLLTGVTAQAMCFNPLGCGPSNLEECRAEAAKMPTDRGVSVALGDCQRKFVTQPAEERRKLDEQRLASLWKVITGSQNAIAYEKTSARLGKPIAEGEVHACLDNKDKPTSEACKWYEWASKKVNPECPARYSSGFSLPAIGSFVYRAEFNVKNGLMQRWYPEAISTCDNAIE